MIIKMAVMRTCCGCFSTKSGTFAVLIFYMVSFNDIVLGHTNRNDIQTHVIYHQDLNNFIYMFYRRLTLLQSLVSQSICLEKPMKIGTETRSLALQTTRLRVEVLRMQNVGFVRHLVTSNMVSVA